MMNRRDLLGGLAVAPALLTASRASAKGATGPSFAITIDDFDIDDGPLMTGAAKHEAILSALAVAGVRAAGFPAGKFVDNDLGRARLDQWSRAGHLIGNHTYAHPYYGGSAPGDLGADIDRAAALLTPHPTWKPLFRFPYLAEGRTRETRDAMRLALHERGLSNGHVTIDASDWYVNGRLLARLAEDPDADITPYRDFHVRHLLDRAAFYDGLARDVLGYSPPHTLLLHHKLTTALFLPDVLRAFAAAGWTAIDAETAFAHPIYASWPDIAPAGNSLIWQLAKADGRFEDRLRSPGEDGEYEKPVMDALGL
jgi:peptidoglycan/xylan/chitin deacetylase (PgdA/CDA1 family)